MKKTRKRRPRPAPIRALAVWVQHPHETLFDEHGRAFYVALGTTVYWLDEGFGRHWRHLGKDDKVPKFEVVRMNSAGELQIGDKPLSYSIVHIK